MDYEKALIESGLSSAKARQIAQSLKAIEEREAKKKKIITEADITEPLNPYKKDKRK